MLSRTANALASHLFGGTCYLCRGSAPAESLLCAACDLDLPRLDEPACPRCALASPGGEVCGRCLAHPPAYDATVAALSYRFPADALVHALKYRGELALAPLFARLLAAKIAHGERVNYLVPVPLSARRLAQRGYNQAVEIARPLAAALDVALVPRLCVRSRDTPAQSELPWAARARNVSGAFRCPSELDGAIVAVLDDVMTTGATLQETALALKRAGAARVVNWVVARTPPPRDA
jgi:ComF family protein